MKYKIGLKLYASNIEYAKIADYEFKRGSFDYIELYVVPGDLKKYKSVWEKSHLPFIIHAAHCFHGINLSKREYFPANKKAYEEAKKYADLLRAPIIIFHPGLAGDVHETARQLKLFEDKKIVIENKPFIALNGKRCVGGSINDIRVIMQESGAGFCLDLTHAIKYAYSNDIDYIEYLRRCMKLNPAIIHISDGNTSSCFDEHLSLGKGNFDFVRICQIIDLTKQQRFITFESPKKISAKLRDFKKDVTFFKNIMKDGVFK
ncbi:MAG: sugar phosphate isomerase/epimerase [Candidatus Margulisbacteria bacterium]|nr:sugar phosphate isomerase/epimerase [Candidatus Margulisiibacteriota bacterium]MBU1021517.1 sugar phosphate isomerase/epimerase [Candidatus Margulisiibacteriota bacterium]MBU1728602.1 sugar phosphate isomerase/epimerase [Candidatus Margulisiibacteriota bacterium]MBU1955819.1 sugar phosphate isomerase/epimerase [Candidatus Margulisiibacteriota bacterium]